MKYKFTKKDHMNIWECFDGLDIDRLRAYIETIRAGEKCELIVRKQISWDTTRMRRFFEGPVVDFVRDRYADTGRALGKGDIREALKMKFLGFTEEHGLRTPVSTTTLTRPMWIKFLNDINDYCCDEFGCGLPEADEVDIGD